MLTEFALKGIKSNEKPKFNLREFYGANGQSLAHGFREAKLGEREAGRYRTRLRVYETTRVSRADIKRRLRTLARRETASGECGEGQV